VFRPLDVALGTNEVRFQRLLLGRDRVHIGIEADFAQDQFPTLNTRLTGTSGASVKERAAQTVAARMSENQ
jgi:hypothetical protein